MVKKSLEILVALSLLLGAVPILCAAALVVWIIDGWPVLYRQTRIGYRGEQFQMWKLRSMRRNSDSLLQSHLATNTNALVEWQTYLRLDRDPRHIPIVGRAIRKSSIDEIPQLWNVIRGDMALIGPRPLPPDQIASLTAQARNERSKVKPGLTGLWQIVGRGDTTIPTLERLDRLYLNRRSWKLDCWILARTVSAVLSGRGAY